MDFFSFNRYHCNNYNNDISINIYFGRKTSLSGSECVRMMEEEAEKEILFSVFFSPQVVSFISFVVCLDLKGGDRLQALFSPG